MVNNKLLCSNKFFNLDILLTKYHKRKMEHNDKIVGLTMR